jgi:hypothetical protein
MSGPQSRLNTLLRVRTIQEEITRGQLAGEVTAERRAAQVLEQAHERYAAPAAEPQVPSETVRGFLALNHHRGLLAAAVSVAATGVDAAARVSVLARRDWNEAAMRMAALERLEDRAREAASMQQLAAEQRTSDESGTAQHRRGHHGDAQGKSL